MAGEILDLFAYDGDAALVGGVEFEDAGGEHGGAVELFGKGENGGCFAGAWGTIEEHVGKLRDLLVCTIHESCVYFTYVGCLEGALEYCDGVVLRSNVV